MHIFHKWEVAAKSEGTASRENLFTGRETNIQIISILERCRCGKKRAFVKELNGSCTKVDADFVEMKFKKAGLL